MNNFVKGVKQYFEAVAEGISQLFNAIHNGNANQTFSARLREIRDGVGYKWVIPDWYWDLWLLFFRKVLPEHLDWAAGPDGD